jgi:large subunit ribosomal protein L1
MRGKRLRATQELIDPSVKYGIDEACELVKKCALAKFDESVDMSVRLGVNPRQADQMVRGALSLPHGTGKSVRVVVFAGGDAARAAEEAGADFVGGDDLVAKIQNEGWVDFDKAIAVRSMMAKVGRLGRILGPRSLMPNPKTGTVVGPDQVAAVVREVKGGRIDYKVERAGIIHTPIGKASMEAEHLRDNALALLDAIVKAKPASAKGTYVKSISISSTMGPGVRLDTNEAVKLSQDVK